MFKGSCEHQLDDKNRLRIPSKFKKELTGENGEKSYSFMRGKHNCILVFDDETLDEVLAPLTEEGISDASREADLIFGSIFSAEEDAQGRVVLPMILKKIAGIKKDLITIGRGNRLEIWAPDKYAEYMAGLDYDSALVKARI